jgi:hypothetical protein
MSVNVTPIAGLVATNVDRHVVDRYPNSGQGTGRRDDTRVKIVFTLSLLRPPQRSVNRAPVVWPGHPLPELPEKFLV